MCVLIRIKANLSSAELGGNSQLELSLAIYVDGNVSLAYGCNLVVVIYLMCVRSYFETSKLWGSLSKL